MSMVIANRYARALADVVSKTGQYHEVLSEIESFRATCDESAELREVLESPAVAPAGRMSLVETLGSRLGLSTVTLNFLRVLVAHYRIALVSEISQAFRRIVNERLGIAMVKVFSASELSEAERQELRARFAQITGKGVEMEFHQDERLLGGIRAQIRSTVYDGTVRGDLDRMRQQLIVG